MSGYLWIYQYRFFDIPWNSPAAWWAGFLAADFVHYWFHRASHEVSFIWSWHQVHHSHEEYNLTVGLRQSMFQQLCALGFYQPMALLGVPLPAICVHFNLNLLVQFIIHTELIGKCGPLEWIINTPSHHRVHHGANKYCLDKNYGGFLIIWDRLFGTFAAEKDDEEIVYGLVDQPQASSILYLQVRFPLSRAHAKLEPRFCMEYESIDFLRRIRASILTANYGSILMKYLGPDSHEGLGLEFDGGLRL
nr:alkylglycerol monooxygenase-like [Cherax quadricarinatus]